MATLRTVTVKLSGGDYTSLSAAEAGEQANLVSLDRQLDIECYAMEDTSAVNISGWTTDATRYIRIYTPASERHDGKWNTGKYRLILTLTADSQPMIWANQSINLYITGLQIGLVKGEYIGGYGVYCISSSSMIKITHCVFRNDASGGGAGGYFVYLSGTGSSYILENCLGYYIGSSSIAGRGYLLRDGGGVIRNCTAHGAAITRAFWSYTANCLTATNCVARGTQDGFYGTFNSGSDYNSSDISGDAPVISPRANNTSPWYSGATADSAIFVDAANYDFHLLSGSIFKDVGADLSSYFTDDIDGQTRSGTWDIGADEYVAAMIPPRNMRRFQHLLAR